VARLAARHGIRVRLRPASMGGLTALVWLPDEVIAHETAGFTGGFRRLDPSALDDPALVGPSLGDPRLGDPGSGGRWAGARAQPGDPAAVPGLPGRHASAPEFADEPQAAGDQGLPGDQEPAGDQEPGGGWAGEPVEAGQALGAARVPRFTDGIPGSGAAAGASTPGTGASVDVIVPPAVSPAAQSRLPIFESVESDWFRRSRRSSDAPEPGTSTEAPEPGTPTEAWSSPADEGWRAAEVAQAPVSDGLTAAGLPQRVPKANLVPGRAGQAGAATQLVPARSAAQTQERLASFQRAVREARAAAQADDAEQGEEGSDQAD
jgi:hypothetical protein